jgi:cytoskeleton protein RodZ
MSAELLMSNESGIDTSIDADGQLRFDGVEAPHAGFKLSHAREKMGLTLTELSSKLKVSERKLELIERGEFEQVSGGHAHVRGLVRAMCKAVGLDPEPVLAQMPTQAVQHPLVSMDTRYAAPFITSERMGKQGYGPPNKRARAKANGLGTFLANPWTLGTIVAVVAAGFMYAWPVVQGPAQLLWQKVGLPNSTQATQSTQPPTPETVKPQTVEKPVTPQTEVASALPAAPIPPLKAANEISSTGAAAAPAAVLPAGDTTTVALAPATTIDPEKLTIEAREPSWIEVRGASGALLVSRNLTPGERLEQGLGNRRTITVGNAAATQVWVRGKEFDVKALARDNVARFEVQ